MQHSRATKKPQYAYLSGMSTIFRIAWRYVFSKRKLNAINWIAGISVAGIALSTAAMVIVLSAFNGIEHLVQDTYGAADPDIQITPAHGKWMDSTAVQTKEILSTEGVRDASPFVRETVIIRHQDNWTLGVVKGLLPAFFRTSDMAQLTVEGMPELQSSGGYPMAVAGEGLMARLGGYIHQPGEDVVPYESFQVFGLQGTRKLSSLRDDAVRERIIQISGMVQVHHRFDMETLLVPLAFAQDVTGCGGRYSGFDVELHPDADEEQVASALAQSLGSDVVVKTRFQQNELIYRTNQSEKKVTFGVLVFIFLLSAFNLVAVLAMMVIEKRRDIRVLSGLGLALPGIRKVFVWQGVIICWLGATAGVLIGLGVCVLQQEFSLITMQGSVVEAYPIRIEAADLLTILVCVFGAGWLLSWLPVRVLLRNAPQAAA
jgi:lipoprotein-releasing system permease protein